MIERLDFDEIDENYFLILAETQYYVVLQSRSTGHYWHLLERIANGHRTFQISHRHNPTDSYHLQTNKPSIRACCFLFLLFVIRSGILPYYMCNVPKM